MTLYCASGRYAWRQSSQQSCKRAIAVVRDFYKLRSAQETNVVCRGNHSLRGSLESAYNCCEATV